MNRFRLFAIATVLAIASLAPAAFAQTPVNISIISGNGQVTCLECYGVEFFDPLFVRVTDANGNPVSGATVTWNITSGINGVLPGGALTETTTTDTNGNANIQFTGQTSIGGSYSLPYFASTINASISSGASVNFYETQALTGGSINGTVPVFVQVYPLTTGTTPPCSTCISPGDTLTGAAGSISPTQFKIVAETVVGSPVPNASLRLVSNQSSPTISCVSEAGADPGSVLTDATGVATCTAILGSTTGSGSFYALVGGVASSQTTGGPAGFFATPNYLLKVTPGQAGTISVAGGNNQSANPGQSLAVPLTATVSDAAGNPLSGQTVVWSVSPTSAASLFSTSTTTNAAGQVQTGVALSNTAAGAVYVNAALVSNPNIAITFAITANIPLTGLQIVSGNSQSAIVNAPFAAPLVVQLTAGNGASVANIPVSFSASGLVSLGALSALTNSSGQAQVNVIAGSTPGAVTVTASAGSFTQTFNLSVIAQGPQISAGNFYNGADLQAGSISPCSLATIIAPGIAPNVQGAFTFNGIGAFPYLLGGDTITVGGTPAPISNVANANGQQQLTFQVPCGVTPGSTAVSVSVNGATGNANVTVLPASPGLFTTPVTGTTVVPVLERPDGSFVSQTNPARRGETLIAYVAGLGPTSPTVATNSLPAPGGTAVVQGTVIVGVAGNGATLLSATLSPDIVGVYQVAFVVPSSLSGGTNADFSIGLLPSGSSKVYYSTLGFFPVQ